jgi:hypothetical protein
VHCNHPNHLLIGITCHNQTYGVIVFAAKKLHIIMAADYVAYASIFTKDLFGLNGFHRVFRKP